MYVYSDGRFRTVYSRKDKTMYFMLDGVRANVGRHTLYRSKTKCSKKKADCERTCKCTWKKGKGCRRESGSVTSESCRRSPVRHAARDQRMDALADDVSKLEAVMKEMTAQQRILQEMGGEDSDLRSVTKLFKQLTSRMDKVKRRIDAAM